MPSEEARLSVLFGHALDAAAKVFDEFAQITAHVCQTPLAAISFVDTHGECFKATVGFALTHVERAASFAACAMDENRFYTITDPQHFTRFQHHPLVAAPPGIRFWAGTPVIGANRQAIGAVSVWDYQPRVLTEPQIHFLQWMAHHVAMQLEERAQPDTRFRQVVEAVPNAIVMVEAGGRIVLVNSEAERLFGYAREEMVGQPIELLIPARFHGMHPKLRAGFYDVPAARPMGAGRDLFGLRADGIEVPIEIGLNPIRTPEGLHVLASIVDITERRRAAGLIEAALAEKTVLLNEIHHRVKNNLQIIAGLILLQASQTSDPRLRDLLEESQNRVRAMGLIHQLLYESGNFSQVQLGQYLHRLADLLWSSGNVRRIRLETSFDDVLVDLNQAIPCGLLVNELISNALKHAFPGDRAGLLQLIVRRGADGQVTVSVNDNGVGLPAGLDPYKAASLGLTLAVQLTEQLGGTLEFGTSLGTRIELTFPPESERDHATSSDR